MSKITATALFVSCLFAVSCGTVTDIGYARMSQPVIVPTPVSPGQEDPCSTTTVPNAYMYVSGIGSPGNTMLAFSQSNSNLLYAATYNKLGCQQGKMIGMANSLAYGGNASWYGRDVANGTAGRALELAKKNERMFSDYIRETAKEELHGGPPPSESPAAQANPGPAPQPTPAAQAAPSQQALSAPQPQQPWSLCRELGRSTTYAGLAAALNGALQRETNASSKENINEEIRTIDAQASNGTVGEQMFAVIKNQLGAAHNCRPVQEGQ